jgi:hypothetical protein
MGVTIIRPGRKPDERATPDEEAKPAEPYSVGYGHPPLHTQFKKGSSGNPRGRPKGSKNFNTIIAEELERTIVVNENGRRRPISRGRALIKRLIATALSGDLKAMALIVKMFPGADQAKHERQRAQDTDQVDLEILAAYREGLLRQERHRDQDDPQ